MPVDSRVTLVLDPFNIYAAQGQRIESFTDELKAFSEIEARITAPPDSTITPLTIIVAGPWIPHFRAYRNVRGVRVEDLTPTKRVKEAIGMDLPNWLTDLQIHEWGLLRLKEPEGGFRGTWEATVASWMFPDVDKAETLADWFRKVAQGLPHIDVRSCSPLCDSLVEQLTRLASSYLNVDEVNEFVGEFNSYESAASFAKTWIKRIAIYPLCDISINNPLQNPAIMPLSPKQRLLAKKLPLLFPLPPALHSEISQCMTESLRKARLRDGKTLERAILKLNALWDGCEVEIENWLTMYPNLLTPKAAAHLSTLPGSVGNSRIQELIKEFAPSTPIREWTGCDEHFDSWVSTYAQWVRNAFARRDFPPPENDPSVGFSRWLKDNSTVTFSHPERSYLTVSAAIRSALSTNRVVVVIMIDALAIHVLDCFREPITQTFGKDPTNSSYVFSPIPTITEISKGAILAGTYPDQSTGDLKADLMNAYELGSEELAVPANWNDATRMKITPELRLIVYRDNRLDDRLSTEGNFRDLLGQAYGLAAQVAALLQRLVQDLRAVKGSLPLVMLTADHGFTYGPATDTNGSDGHHRCVDVDSPPAPTDPGVSAMTFIDKTMFHNRQHYLAVRERRIPTGTVTGWKMSHGGLLPEEVIIPFVEWFGAEAAIVWPKIEAIGDAYRELGNWRFAIRMSNPQTRPVVAGTVVFREMGQTEVVKRDFTKLLPGQQLTFQISLPTDAETDTSDLKVEAAIELLHPNGSASKLDQTVVVRKARQLVERTAEQESFESMF